MAESKSDPDWIQDGEKYALIGLDVRRDRNLDRLNLANGLTVLPNAAFDLPHHWQEWLGTIRVENIDQCSLFLVAKMVSAAPAVLDSENELLQRRVDDLFIGLLLAGKFSSFNEPFRATGSRVEGAIDVRNFAELDAPQSSVVADSAPIAEGQLRNAARIAERLQAFHGPWLSDHWRLLRCLGIYQGARNNRDILDRIHQFTRCIEGMIASKQGETRRQFKSRTELFIGPSNHALMGELYEVRSDIEHLHEYKHLEARDRPTRIRLAELEAVSEWIARSCLARILLDPALMTYFGSADSLEQFWTKPKAERQEMWGPPVDPNAPLQGFEFAHVSDATLGSGP